MESTSFRCESCAASLRAPADKAGQRVRCKRCGTVLTVPQHTEPKARFSFTGGTTGSDSPEEARTAGRETEDQTETAPTKPRKRRRGRLGSARSADPRSESAWRKVRLGLILIGWSMCWYVLAWLVGVLGWLLSFAGISFDPLSWAPLRCGIQALPIVGNLLCAFVPLKGPARTLSLANLGVIALGLALTLWAGRVAGWIAQRGLDAALARNQELTKKATEGDKEEQDLRKQLADSRQKATTGNKDAATDERELRQRLDDLQAKRLVALQRESERMLAEVKDLSSKSLTGFMDFWGYIYVHGITLSTSIQIIILTFFIRALALALGDRDLAGMCPRVAAIALLTLILGMLLLILPLRTLSFVFRLFTWTDYLLGMVSYVWQGLILVEACALIDKHTAPKRPEDCVAAAAD